MKELIEQLRYRIDLRFDQAREASRQLADPGIAEEQKADFLVALKQKGESGEELGYFARSFLEMAIRPALHLEGRQSIDVVGTGGDRLELINVSTTCMFVLAAAGVVVLKHGNRAITSKSGAADVLETLGIPIACTAEQMVDCIHQTGVGFFFAPLYHPAFRLVAPIRKKLAEQGIATVFNLLGPLLNPAGPTAQLTGVFSPTILEKYAIALREVGRSRAWVVHGQVLSGSGMDEISSLGETEVYEVKGRRFKQISFVSGSTWVQETLAPRTARRGCGAERECVDGNTGKSRPQCKAGSDYDQRGRRARSCGLGVSNGIRDPLGE